MTDFLVGLSALSQAEGSAASSAQSRTARIDFLRYERVWPIETSYAYTL